MNINPAAPRFSNPHVRDLYWALRGPGILACDDPVQRPVVRDDWFEDELNFRISQLFDLDRDPKSLESYLIEKTGTTQRLGRYFEALLSFWIEHFVKPHRFATNLIISGSRDPGMKKNTLGELDLVFQTNAGEVAEHWEAAVKFYVFAGTTSAEASDPKNYVGTMVRDRLDLKIAKLFRQQLKITERDETKAALHKLGIETTTSRAVVKGALFFPLCPSGPLQAKWNTHPTPMEVSAVHHRGWWISSDQSNRLHHHLSSDSVFIILDKIRWLSPGRVTDEAATMSHEELRQFLDRHFTNESYPIMIAELSPGRAGEMEVSRGLVLDPGWRSRAQIALGKIPQNSQTGVHF